MNTLEERTGEYVKIRIEQPEIELLTSLYNETVIIKEDVLPHEWYERKRILMPSSGTLPGYVSYYNTPYWKEPVNCISQFHPATDITIVGPAQDGKTFMVLEPMIGYTMECNPASILHLTGNSDLAPDASLRVDTMIDRCGLRYLMKPSTQKLRNNRTGDTAIRKEFPNGIYRNNSITKKNALRQNDVLFLLLDDADAAKKVDSKVGNIWDVAKDRTKAFEWKAKRVCTSSPETEGSSIVWEVYLRSDQRRYFVPCPCCHDFIELLPEVKVDDKKSAGLIWKLDNLGRVDPKTVGYLCQKCAGFFTDQNKLVLMNDGKWIPTVEPKELHHYGYKKSACYAPPGMTSWLTIIQKRLACYQGENRDEAKWKTYVNGTLGDVYQSPKEEIKASDLLRNEREYQLGVVPESISKHDGNGEIIHLTFTADVNGKLNDARLDWAILAWAASGAIYLVAKGSIGSFVPHEKPSDREKRYEAKEVWTYELNRKNSVWKEVDRIMSEPILTDTGRKMKVFMGAIDTGYLEEQVFNYIDNSNFSFVGVKGEKESALLKVGVDVPVFKVGRSRPNLFLVQVNMVKNDLAALMRLKWNRDDDMQPFGFMNFPKGLGFKDFYEHFEAEHRVEEYKNGVIVGFKWEKKSPTAQNHFFDVTVYQFALREILLWQVFKKEGKVDKYSWVDFVTLVIGQKP